MSRGNLLGGPLSLSDLFHPGTFLNALRQQSSRRLNAPMDDTKLISAWDRGKISGSDLVATIEGLFVEGAELEPQGLVEMAPSAAEMAPAPPLHLAFVGKNHGDPYQSVQTIDVPIYHSMSREKHLVSQSRSCPSVGPRTPLSVALLPMKLPCSFFCLLESLTPRRTPPVLSQVDITIPSKGDPSRWVLAGVAIFLSSD